MTFNDLPPTVQLALAFRAEFEHFGWPDYTFIGYGCKLTNIPLGSLHVPPPNATLISVHLQLPGRGPDDEFVVITGYLDNDKWPAEATLLAATDAWNALTQDERNEVRKRAVTVNDVERLAHMLISRGFIPPALAELAVSPPVGRN